MKYDIIVLMTAICRTHIHNKMMPNIMKLLLNSKIINDIHFFVNIDNICGIVKETQDKVQQNFQSYFNIQTDKKIYSHFNLSSNPCFFSAVKNLVMMSQPIVSKNTLIFYLEDDWYLNDKYVKQSKYMHKFDTLISKYIFKNSYLSLCSTANTYRRIPYRFRPCIWSPVLFNQIFVPAILKQKNKLDPEKIIRKYSAKYSRKIKYNIHYYMMFTDIGRKWQKQNKLRKWDKNRKLENITYNIKQTKIKTKTYGKYGRFEKFRKKI